MLIKIPELMSKLRLIKKLKLMVQALSLQKEQVLAREHLTATFTRRYSCFLQAVHRQFRKPNL